MIKPTKKGNGPVKNLSSQKSEYLSSFAPSPSVTHRALTIFAGAALTMFVSTASATVIAYYDFQNTLNDQSANTNHLSNAGGAVITQDTAVFDGTATSYLFTTAALDLSGASDLTIEFFMKSASTAGGYIFEQGNVGAGAADGSIATVLNDGGAGNIRQWHRDSLTLGREQDPGNTVGVWRHYAFLFDPGAAADADKLQIYVDGVTVDNAIGAPGALTSFLNETFAIGAKANGSGIEFEGSLDDFRISDTLLTTAEFIQVRSVAVPEPQTLVLFACGVFALIALRRRQHRPRCV